ncbi:MAG: hypothetical protein JO111_13400 [Caulobacteraceae bacterium]|nr:hypothetical protein [Caulobacteraceae bacterium]
MDSVWWVAIAAIAFVGTHFLLSHPLRAPVAGVVGERGFLGVYSLVSIGTFVWLVIAFQRAPPRSFLWVPGNITWAIVTLVMLLASVLFMGSLLRNPALPNPVAAGPAPAEARGVFAITRHPMMWSFALWGLCHMAVLPTPPNLILCVAIVFLALVGSAMQDRKKAILRPEMWPEWEAKTSYWPFAAVTAGKARLVGFGGFDLGGGLVLWLVATWAHIPLAHVGAGIWRWILH